MNEFVHWLAPPERLVLSDGVVHVWRANLDVDADRLTELRTVLAPEEIERANRYVFEPDRLRFEAARGILRRLLSTYRNYPAAEIEIRTNAFGKPFIDGDMCFNISHSGSIAVYAFARDTCVGIDLERIRTDVECIEIARRHFTDAEIEELESAPKERQSQVFFRGWTRKEAYVKAVGQGLSTSLRSFEIGLADGETRLASNSDNRLWVVKSFVPRENYVATVISCAANSEFAWWEFSI